MLDIRAKLLFLTTHRGHRIPPRPEAFPVEVALSSTTLARHGDGTLTFDRANHLGHRILWRNPDEPVDMGLHPRPCHDGAAPRLGQLTQHWPKTAPDFAIQRFLASLWAKDYVIFTIPLCVAEPLRRCCCHALGSLWTAQPSTSIRQHHLPLHL